MCGKRLRFGWLLLVVWLLGSLGSLWADVSLTDQEWEELKAQIQIIQMERQNLESELATIKTKQGETILWYETALEEQKAQVDVLTKQQDELKILLGKSKTAESNWQIGFWASLGALLMTILGGFIWPR